MPTLFLTGASSFTGCHIARAFKGAGWRVRAALTRAPDKYGSVALQERLRHCGFDISRGDEWIHDAPFGSPRMLEALAGGADVFLNHGADIKGYRSADFDVGRSVSTSLHNLESVLDALGAAKCRRFLHSGSIFEPTESLPAVSAYGESKARVWQAILQATQRRSLPLSKIVIPNPIGAFENEDRLLPVFARAWRNGDLPHLQTPDTVWDNVPAPWLARFYVEEAEASGAKLSQRAPSAFVLSVKAFLEQFTQEYKSAGGVRELPIKIGVQGGVPPVTRRNSEMCAELENADERARFWGDYFKWLGLL